MKAITTSFLVNCDLRVILVELSSILEFCNWLDLNNVNLKELLPQVVQANSDNRVKLECIGLKNAICRQDVDERVDVHLHFSILSAQILERTQYWKGAKFCACPSE